MMYSDISLKRILKEANDRAKALAAADPKKVIEFRGVLEKYGYQIDDENRAQVKKAAILLVQGGRGLLLYGTTGTGKSLLMKMASAYFETEFLTAPEIIREYDSREAKDFWAWFSQYKYKNLILDDLFADREKASYNRASIIPDIIFERENSYRDFGKLTHYTSNCKSPEEIKERYNEKSKSRILGMCSPVMFVGRDRRAEG